MKKLLIVSGIFFLVGLATTEVMGQNPNARQSTPSSSRVQTTTSSTANSAAARQMKKGDSQLNKANSSYQRAQSSASRTSTTTYTPSNRTAAPATRTNTSSSASRTSNSTVKPNTSSSASRTNTTVSKPTTTSSSSSSRVSTTTTTKPASNANVTRTNTTSNTSSANRVAAPTSATAQAANRTPSPTAAVSDDDFSKRGYNSNGNAKPQPAPVAHANGPKPIPYVHPNYHNFGHYMTIPPRIRPVYYHGLPYYFYNSLFCRYINGRYIICRPPIGAVIAYTIFNSWKPVIVVHNNINYYYDDGSFYRPAPNRVDYVVVDPPIGARVAELPSNYEEIILDNQVYFKVDNVYYKEVIVSGYIWYEVVFVS